jgi:glycerol-3-phosphate dehydrogenase
MIQEARSRGFDKTTATNMTHRYGTRMEAVLDCADGDAVLSRRIVPDLPFAGAEAVYAAEQEMVVTLQDLVRRRIPLFILHRLSTGTLGKIAATVAPALDWSPETQAREVRSLAGPPGGPGFFDRRRDI